MNWTALGTPISLTTRWQYSPASTAEYFRFKHTGQVAGAVYQVCSAQQNSDGTVDLFDSDALTLAVDVLNDVAHLPMPPCFSGRAIAIRIVPARPSFEQLLRQLLVSSVFQYQVANSAFYPSDPPQWSVQIEASDATSTLSSQVAAVETDLEGKITALQTDIDPQLSQIKSEISQSKTSQPTVQTAAKDWRIISTVTCPAYWCCQELIFKDKSGTDVTNGGTPNASSNTGNAHIAFDKQTSDWWTSLGNPSGAIGNWLQYTFPQAVDIYSISVNNHTNSGYLPPTEYDVQNSDDGGTTWNTIWHATIGTNDSQFYDSIRS